MHPEIDPFDTGYWQTDALRDMGFAAVGNNVKIAKGTQIIGREKVSIGNNVRIDGFVNIIAAGGPGVSIGSYIHIGAYCHFSGSGGGITISDFCNLSQGVRLYSGSDDYSGDSLTNPMVPKRFKNEHIAPIHLGRHVIIGSGSVVLPGVSIGDGAAVGALSLVNKSVEAWKIVAGTPAKFIKPRSQKILDLESEMLKHI